MGRRTRRLKKRNSLAALCTQSPDEGARLTETDRLAGFEITTDFARFGQMNEMFTRALWEPRRQKPAYLVGTTELDERWSYTERRVTRTMTTAPHELPDGLSQVIVMGHARDFDLVETYPPALAGASTGREYSRETAIALPLAAYIRKLGYIGRWRR